MKKYTLLQAITEIERSFDWNTKQFSGIMYEDGSLNKFIVSFLDGSQYFVNLDDCTTKRIK